MLLKSALGVPRTQYLDEETATVDSISNDEKVPTATSNHIAVDITGVDESEEGLEKIIEDTASWTNLPPPDQQQFAPTHSAFNDDAHGASHMKENTIWDVYNNEARIVDRELVKDWESSLNSLLLFAAIFAAVLTAFIIESKKYLEQDPADLIASLMIFYINNQVNGTPRPYVPGTFEPPHWAVLVNCVFFSSLSLSLVAALASVVALQWVAEYDAAITRGGSSPLDRVKRRQLRFGGVRTWKMGEIIAAIPLLLYFSVLLFFIGLIQWMWIVHRVVGYIILIGGLSACIIYFTSTMTAVIFPAAPFRTPLSKWIYSFIHLPISFGYHLFRHFGCWNLGWFESRRYSKATKQDRDNLTIKANSNLICDGLVWLSTHISISSDSHRRLMLLLKEVLSLSWDQLQSERFIETPWKEIFEELGSRYLGFLPVYAYTDEDIEGMSILLQCLQNPSIGTSKNIPNGLPDQPSLVHKEASLSHTGVKYVQNPFMTGNLGIKRPSATYLLLGHLPSKGDGSPETQVKFRLAQIHYMHKDAAPLSLWRFHWRSLLDQTLHYQDLHKQLIRESYQALGQASSQNAQRRVDGLAGLLSIAWAGFGKASPMALVMNHPFLYRLHSKSWIDWRSIQEMSTYCNFHEIFAAMLKVQEDCPDLQPLWRCVASEPEIDDVLSGVNRRQRGQLSNSITEELRNLRLVEALETFDNLITKGCTPEQHDVMVKLACQDLETAASLKTYREYFNQERLERLGKLRDPALRLIICTSAGIQWSHDWPLVYGDNPLWHSWARASRYCCGSHPSIKLETIGRLRTQIWETLDISARNNLLYRALGDIDALKQLELQLSLPELGIDHGADHLLFLLSKIGSRWDPGPSLRARPRNFHQIQGVRLVVALLLRRPEDPLPVLLIDSIPVDDRCVEYLAGICEEITNSPTRLMSLVTRVYTSHIPDYEEFKAMVLVLERHLDPEKVNVASTIRCSLAMQLSAKVAESTQDLTWWDPREEADWLFRCSNVIHALASPRTQLFGKSSGRYMSCMRAPYNQDAGPGWLGIYDAREAVSLKPRDFWRDHYF